MFQVICPDGKFCPDHGMCCPSEYAGSYFCCVFGHGGTCCSEGEYCCPPRHACLTAHRVCAPLTDSPALPVQAILLVNSIDKRGRDGTAGMDSKDSKMIPLQQLETAWKRNGFIGTSGNVFSPDEKYLCPDGTSICEPSSGIYGCCHLVRGYAKFWQENSCFSGFGKLYFHYQSLNQLFSYIFSEKQLEYPNL